MKDYFKKLLSGIDNETPDLIRVLGFVGFIVYLSLVGYNVIVLKVALEIGIFAGGITSILAGIGAGIAIKHKTEPQANK